MLTSLSEMVQEAENDQHTKTITIYNKEVHYKAGSVVYRLHSAIEDKVRQLEKEIIDSIKEELEERKKEFENL